MWEITAVLTHVLGQGERLPSRRSVYRWGIAQGLASQCPVGAESCGWRGWPAGGRPQRLPLILWDDGDEQEINFVVS